MGTAPILPLCADLDDSAVWASVNRGADFHPLEYPPVGTSAIDDGEDGTTAIWHAARCAGVRVSGESRPEGSRRR
eukprot:496583-Pleurochrysis_carterae.AAC.1